jgi:hypothetical protein
MQTQNTLDEQTAERYDNDTLHVFLRFRSGGLFATKRVAFLCTAISEFEYVFESKVFGLSIICGKRGVQRVKGSKSVTFYCLFYIVIFHYKNQFNSYC